jgi:hypothetical protein
MDQQQESKFLYITPTHNPAPPLNDVKIIMLDLNHITFDVFVIPNAQLSQVFLIILMLLFLN